MEPVKYSPGTPTETTDLERRVLAHERVLQALIAYIARTEPRFLDHLCERFVEPMRMARHEHDYRETDDYAEEFIRAIIIIGEKAGALPANAEAGGAFSHSLQEQSSAIRSHNRQHAQGDRVLLREKDGIWEIKVDGAFHGDYPQKERALAAMALIKLALR